MDEKSIQKRLRGKLIKHMLFGLGGAVVIIGALFKILHLEFGPITGGLVLGIGLGTEALIFTASALATGEIHEEHDEYVSKVKGGSGAKPSGGGPGLSSKIDALMTEAKLDVQLMNRLTKSIKDLESSAQALNPATNAVSASEAYADKMSKAASQMEELNAKYQEQINSAQGNTEFNEKIASNARKLKAQMDSMNANLASLNQVYSGMLNAMEKK